MATDNKEFKVKVAADANDLKSNIGGAIQELGALSGGLIGMLQGGLEKALTSPLAAAAAAVGAIAYGIHRVLDYTQEIIRVSARGMSQRQAAGFIVGAEKSGAEPETLLMMMNRMRRAQSMAMENDTGAQAKAFQELGLSLEEVGKAVPLELFIKLTKILEDGNLSGTKFSAMTRILGRDFTALTVAAQAGLVGNIEESIKNAMSDEEIDRAKELNKTMRETRVEVKENILKGSNKVLEIIDNIFSSISDVLVNGPFIKKEAPQTMRVMEQKRDAWWAAHPPGSSETEKLTKSQKQEQQLKQRQEEAEAEAKAKRELRKSLESRGEQLEGSLKGYKEPAMDKFARMGLYLTSGAQRGVSDQVKLHQQELAELKQIKTTLKEMKTIGEDGAF